MRPYAPFAALALALGACSAGAGPASAQTHRADPSTLAQKLAAAKPGDRIVLAPGSYPDVTIPPKDHATPVEIDGRAATVRSITFRNTSGWHWQGGTVNSPLPPEAGAVAPRNAVWRNVMIDNARRIELTDVTLTGGDTGVLVTRGSSDITLRGNLATGLRSDGFNIATAKRVSLIGNTCRDFRPTAPIWDAAGKVMLKDGSHADCIMMWSEAGKEPTSDITIIGNRADGKMQGIGHFYHPKLGRDKVYRVRVEDNELTIFGQWHGIQLENTPGSIVRGNVVRTAPGSVAPGRPNVRPAVWVKTDSDAVRCGNEVDGKRDRRC